jgi:NarL family two-component system response regulator LiaR
MIGVLVVDDHSIVREGLRSLIETEPGMELVAEAGDGNRAVSLARMLRPDVILMDLVMPNKDGIQAIREIKEEDPAARILVLTSFSEDDRVFSAIKSGALGYLLKDASPGELLQGIRDVYEGKSSMPPEIAGKLIHELQRPAPADPITEPLTRRELEVLRLLARGLTNREIAETLTLSERTIRSHVSNILGKLHLANRTQAARYAYEEGLTD